MKNLLVLFVFLLIVLTIKEKNNVGKAKKIVPHRIDVTRYAIVDTKFTVFIPRSIKFGQELVNPNIEGMIYLYVNDKLYCYVREVGVPRNEYSIDSECGEVNRMEDLKVGDEIEFNFSSSNMWQAENVPLFGEKEVDNEV